MDDAQPSADEPPGPPRRDPQSSPPLPLLHSTPRRPESRQSSSGESERYWDSQTSAALSPPLSPAQRVDLRASDFATIASRRGPLSDTSFTTATQQPYGSSPPDIGLISPTPLPTRLQSERQRWLLSRSTRNARSDTYPPPSAPSQRDSSEGPASEPDYTSYRKSPASRSSNGIENSRGPPPALLSRRSQPRDSARKSPTSKIVAQRGLQPLTLVALRGIHNRQDSDTTVRPNTSHLSSGLKSPRSFSSPMNMDTLLSPKTLPLGRRMDGRPTSSGRAMGRTAVEEYFEASAHTSGEDESPGQDLGGSGTEGQSSEDVFLNLAQDSPHRNQGTTQLERRRSGRSARPGQRQSLPLSSSVSRADSSEQDSTYGPPSAYGNTQRIYSRRPSQIATSGLVSYRDSSPMSAGGRVDSASRLDAYRSRYYTQRAPQSIPNGPKSPELPSYGRRRPSITEGVPSPQNRTNTYRPSKLNNAYADLDSSSNVETPPEHGRKRALSRAQANGDTESIGSGNAPSTMWDELEDLKSRIRRIEFTGKAPSAAGVGVQSSTSGSNERPRTATTTVTTMSSSPKVNKLNRKSGPSPPATTAAGDASVGGSALSGIHPLLHAALGRCKSALKPELYRVLEAAATDALELATMTGSAGPQGTTYTAASIINGATVTDRHVRRKADNMCRTLTELCIALCESQAGPASRRGTGTDPDSPAVTQSIENRPGSKHGPQQVETPTQEDSPAPAPVSYARHAVRSGSLEPESAAGGSELPRSSPSRALSRIEARRNSLNVMGLTSNSSANNSPRDMKAQQIDEDAAFVNGDTPPQQQRVSGLPSRFSRAGTSLLRTRRRAGEEMDDDDPTIRPLSRAMTDVAAGQNQLRIPGAGNRDKRVHRLSREYTSNEPLPEHAPLPASGQLNGNSLRRVTASNLAQQQGVPFRDAGSVAGSVTGSLTGERRRYLHSSAPPVAYDGERQQRVTSLGPSYPPSRRSSAGLSMNRKIRGQQGVAVEGGME
ncbi:hypothetical protein NA57DRAFT_72859 [Rhizodiscina lignyota]|uniref:LPXTG-motif cell wall anchor domain protein n=1 Tax=Rhizodiscina lignyota TaxID=1504668 RepID=A0A9P4INL6_9PEZI|nr:hypothetical protein NA57DRAFT_72859 [Rhizodiscina lignyota]